MKHPVDGPKARRFIVPWALFAGMVVAFVACCVAGRLVSKKHQLVQVTRFHQLLTPEAMFYPTASQVHQLALDQTKKKRINVIVGGSSVMQGTGQVARQMWTKKLAALLGPEYRVLNLAIRSGRSGEVGAIVSEMLMDRRQVIFLTDVSPGYCDSNPDGIFYRYLFWDAWYKGMIDRNIPERNARLAELPKERDKDPKFGEVRRGAQIDAEFFFNDLWNTLSYTTGGTVWNHVNTVNSFRPKRLLADNEPLPVPVEERPALMHRLAPVGKVKSGILSHAYEKGPDGRWTLDSEWKRALKSNLASALPNHELRQRTIVSISMLNPYIVGQFSEEEQAKFSSLTAITKELVEETGMRCVVISGTIEARILG